MKKIIMVLSGLLVVFIIIVNFMLLINKTFYHTSYKTIDDNEIFIPRFSYFGSECCMTAATFYSLKSKHLLDQEISEYLNDFTYFNNNNTYGYVKGDLFIQSYEVIDLGFYRKIVIIY
ncbi:MAG: hypothetical protein HFI86_00765 [Bacilli bacterium]|nr:hypothetical protein [Bacilli bacterium]